MLEGREFETSSILMLSFSNGRVAPEGIKTSFLHPVVSKKPTSIM
jgi:hypothetical protein